MASKKKKDEPVYSDRAAQYAALRNQYGDIARKTVVKPVDRSLVMPSMCISLDILTNEGGYRPASIVEWYGMPGVTKTRSALQMVKAAQVYAPDKSIAIIDTEGDMDLTLAEKLGVEFGFSEDGITKLSYYPDPEVDEIPNLEQLLNRIHDFAASGLFSLIVLDSVAMCIPLWEQKNEDITGTKFGGPALPLSTGFRKIKAVCHRTGTRLWLVNQMRTSTIQTPQGPMSKDGPGGGNALKFAANHRYKVSWVKKAKEDDEYALLRITAEKVKYGPSDRFIEVPVKNGLIDAAADLVQVAARYGVIEKKGAWYYYDGSAIGNGLALAAESLRIPQLYQTIYDKTIALACPVTELEPEPEEAEVTE